MNMRILIKNLIVCLLLGTVIISCKKEETKKDNYVVNPESLLPPSAGKTKLKSDEQYVSILHANLFQKALSANEIYEISQCMESIGDKELAREVIISNFMNRPGVILPSNEIMRADIDLFIEDVYKRFLVRQPTEAEKEYFQNYIEANPNVTPELVYFSFALSNEYLYY